MVEQSTTLFDFAYQYFFGKQPTMANKESHPSNDVVTREIIPAPETAKSDGRRLGVYQMRCREWIEYALPFALENKMQRRQRFLEEVVECLDMAGMSEDEMHGVVYYVKQRDSKKTRDYDVTSHSAMYQEAGGVMTTFAVLCEHFKIDMVRAGEDELEAIWHPARIEKIRDKDKAKPVDFIKIWVDHITPASQDDRKETSNPDRIPPMHEAYNFMKSNPLTSQEMMREIEMGLPPFTPFDIKQPLKLDRKAFLGANGENARPNPHDAPTPMARPIYVNKLGEPTIERIDAATDIHGLPKFYKPLSDTVATQKTYDGPQWLDLSRALDVVAKHPWTVSRAPSDIAMAVPGMKYKWRAYLEATLRKLSINDGAVAPCVARYADGETTYSEASINFHLTNWFDEEVIKRFGPLPI